MQNVVSTTDLHPGHILQEGSVTNPEAPSASAPLAVADWTPSSGNSEAQPVHSEAERQGGSASAPENRRTSSTEDTTESDSEKDAAEVYDSTKSRQSPGEIMRGKGASLLQKRAASAEQSSPRKLRCREGRMKGEGATAEECEAIAALEHFKSAGSMNPGTPFGLTTNTASLRPPTSACTSLPMAAIQDLARLIRQQQQLQSQQALAQVQQSPFQGRPASPGTRVSEAGPPLHMRSCFSESSAERLGAIDKKDGSAISLLQSIMATNNHFHRQAARDASSPSKPGFTFDEAVAALKQAGVGIRPSNVSLPTSTHSFNAASDHAVDMSALLSLNLKNAAPASFAQQELRGSIPHSEAAAVSGANPPLSSGFGSIIPGSVDCFALRQGSGPFPASSAPISSLMKQPSASAGGVEASISQPLGFSPVKQHASREYPNSRERGSGVPLSAPTAAATGMPDPRILDWVLGNRGTLTDRGTGGLERGKGMDRQLPRVYSEGRQALHSAPDSSKAASKQASSTLSRPVAVRAQTRKDALPSASSDANMDLLLARLHACSAPTSLIPLGASGAVLPSAGQQPGLAVASDMQRVMQWAGTELSLRDRKVREVERQRMEERTNHDNTISAVAAEVSRLKFGQAELVKAHRQYQEALSQKDHLLEEKNQLIARLSKGLAESRTQYKIATQENESLQRDKAQLKSQLAQHQPAMEQGFPGAVAEDVPASGNEGADAAGSV